MGGAFLLMSRNMKEDTGFSYLGTLPNFEKLLEKVSLFTNNDWTKYKKRNTGIAAEYSDTIPIIYDFKLNISSNIRHEHYELFGDHIFDLIKSIREKLGDVEAKQAMLTRLRAGVEIKRHKDVGPITKKTHRIHVPVITNEDCIFTISDEKRNLQAGQIWLIDNTDRFHSVINNGNIDRVHLIVDVI